MSEIQPRYIAGSVTPLGEARHPQPKLEPLVPADVKLIASPLEINDYTTQGVDEAVNQRYWACVEDLVSRGAKSVSLVGMPIASQLTRPRVLSLLEETRKRYNVHTDAHAEAVIDALKFLGVNRIAIASRWTDELNQRVHAYLSSAGVEILTITTAGQWAQQAFSMSIDAGMRMAVQLGREAMRNAPKAEALFLAGGAWRSLAAVPIHEEDYRIPCLTNPVAQVWRLMEMGVAPPVQGWGRLLAMHR
jgi:arylmalonate decarboxylase